MCTVLSHRELTVYSTELFSPACMYTTEAGSTSLSLLREAASYWLGARAGSQSERRSRCRDLARASHCTAGATQRVMEISASRRDPGLSAYTMTQAFSSKALARSARPVMLISPSPNRFDNSKSI